MGTPSLTLYRHSYGRHKGYTLALIDEGGGYRIGGLEFGAASHTPLASFPLDQHAVDEINAAWRRSRPAGTGREGI